MMPHTGSYTFFQSTVSGTNQHSHAKRELCFVDLEAARLQQWSNEKKMFTCLSLWRKCKIYVFKNLTTIYILHLQTHFNTYDFNFILYYNMPGTSYARIYSPWWYWDICPNSTITRDVLHTRLWLMLKLTKIQWRRLLLWHSISIFHHRSPMSIVN